MSDIDIRITGRAGRITLTRPQALNALSYDMCMAIDVALRNWREDDAVDLVILDAEGEKAFCAGGDIAELYETGTKGDFAYGQTFWKDEYRLNAMIFEYPKPVISFLQGFTWVAVLASVATAATELSENPRKSPCRNARSV